MYLLTSREESYQFQTGAEVLKVRCLQRWCQAPTPV